MENLELNLRPYRIMKVPAIVDLDWQTIDCFSSIELNSVQLFSKNDFQERDYVSRAGSII